MKFSLNSTIKIKNNFESNTQKSNVLINDFNFIFYEDYLSDIYDLLVKLNNLLFKNFNFSLNVNNKFTNDSNNNYEIVIGNIFNYTEEYYNKINNNQIIIKFIKIDGKIKLLVGGNNKNSNLAAINMLFHFIENGLIFDKSSKYINYNFNKTIDLDTIFLDNYDLKNYTFICNNSCDNIVKNCVKLFVNDISKFTNHKHEILFVNSINEIETSKAFYFGFTNIHINRLPINTYIISSKFLLDESKYYISGTSNQEILYAIQHLYKKSIHNQNLNIPKYIYLENTSIILRDPFILPHNNIYYMYSAYNSGFIVRTSKDLINWSEENIVFDKNDSKSFYGIDDFWAPECHYYNGNFYLFVTYKSSKTNHRGCAIFKSSTPDGRFKEITNGHITPSNWDAIDGTLYIDKNNKPYMVFVHEWTSMPDGNGLMCYAPLSDDFTHFTAEPKTMFKSTDPSWTDQCVTDGPWLYRLENGTLLMIWSNFARDDFNGYTIGISKSSNGELDGTWEHYDEPLYWDDNSNIYKVINGGHGMIFKGFDNRIYLSLHGPNDNDNCKNYFYKLTILPLIEDLKNNTLKFDVL